MVPVLHFVVKLGHEDDKNLLTFSKSVRLTVKMFIGLSDDCLIMEILYICICICIFEKV